MGEAKPYGCHRGSRSNSLAGVVGLVAVLVVLTRANADLAHSRAAVQARYELAVEAIKTFHTGVSQDFLLEAGPVQGAARPAAEFGGRLAKHELNQVAGDCSASGAVHNNLADALASRGRMAEALAQWRAGLRLEPDRVPALKRAAWILATSPDARLRDGRQAVALAERAAALTGGGDPSVLDVLGAAYAETGRFPEAAATATRALTAANAQGNRQVAEAIEARIALYEKRARFREVNHQE